MCGVVDAQLRRGVDRRPRTIEITAGRAQDNSFEDSNELPEPQNLAREAITELEAVVDDLRRIVALIEREEGVEK